MHATATFPVKKNVPTEGSVTIPTQIVLTVNVAMKEVVVTDVKSTVVQVGGRTAPVTASVTRP